jgi:outer membrane lipoprotein-sorting protein
VWIAGSSAPRLTAADDFLQRSRATYGELRSYADTGVVIEEYGADSKDRHTFGTYFNRTPRRFSFDFRKEGGDRYVIWGDPDAFHTWWKTTGVQEDYPNPNNVTAFTTADAHSYGSGLKIPALLYSKASLQGTFANFSDVVVDGTEDVSGHRCHRLLGTTRDVYAATGREVGVRKLTVWIDAESLLIRKTVEQSKALPGQISRRTTTYEPQANPVLDEGRFRFSPPAPK